MRLLCLSGVWRFMDSIIAWDYCNVRYGRKLAAISAIVEMMTIIFQTR
jgi:hypothetical protein